MMEDYCPTGSGSFFLRRLARIPVYRYIVYLPAVCVIHKNLLFSIFMNTSTVTYPSTPAQIDEKIIQPSSSFKAEVFKVLLAIIFFIATYLLLMGSAILLAALCGYGGFMMIVGFPRFMTLMLGIGLIGLGVMVVIFLLKFLFKRNRVDRSHLIEIKKADYPELFSFIRRLTMDTAAPFPKKIYVSPEVNASVFYDSGFWSMFLPVKKNLQIGLGLVNSVNVSEFKAILAHEFGHFSQRSMKLGSYIYNVNQIIYNLLYDNEGYGKMLEKWANVSGYFAFFAGITVKIVQGIQWILQKMYAVVNKSYMSLSRQMEFHADSVAASVSGSLPLISSLRRLEVADTCYNTLFDHYNLWYKRKLKPVNIYPQHTEVMKHFAEDHNLTLDHGLPQVDSHSFAYYNRSRIMIKDQWASHPSTDDREDHLRRLNIKAEEVNLSAWTLFRNAGELQRLVTDKIFSSVTFESTPGEIDMSLFRDLYNREVQKYSFDKRYKGFYNARNITEFEVEEVSPLPYSSLDELLDKEAVSLPFTIEGIKKDLNTLQAIQAGSLAVKTFEFEGRKFKKKDAKRMIDQLNAELREAEARLEQLDKSIFGHFLNSAKKGNQEVELKERYKKMFAVTKESDHDTGKFIALMTELNPIYYNNLPLTDIQVIMAKVKNIEIEIKGRIRELIKNEDTSQLVNEVDRAKLEEYISKEHFYFENNEFNNGSLALMNEATSIYQSMVFDRGFQLKKELLDWQLDLN
jgi:Zn-dependent protease with chaperone function